MSEPATASDKAVEAPKAAVSGQTVAKFVKAGPVVKRKNIRKRETDGSDGSVSGAATLLAMILW